MNNMPWVKFVDESGTTVAKYHTAGDKAAKEAYDEAVKKAEAATSAAPPTPPRSPSPPCSDEEERMHGVMHSWA